MNIEEATNYSLSLGWEFFHLFRMENEDMHASLIRKCLPLKNGDIVVDMGCGVGSVVKMLAEFRNADFILVNNSEYQLDLCQDEHLKICCDMTDTPLPDKSTDVVMFNYSIGYADIHKAFVEAARILKNGGILFIMDMAGDFFIEESEYTVHSQDFLTQTAIQSGFKVNLIEYTDGSIEYLKPSAFADRISHLKPIIYVMEKS